MKKLFIVTLALAMAISLCACGEETNLPIESSKPSEASEPIESVVLVDVTTDDGVKLKLPSGMVKQENGSYANPTTTDVAVIQVIESDGVPYSQWTKDEFVASELEGRQDLVVVSYENDMKINGKDALVCKSNFTTESGYAVATTMVMVTDGISDYIIVLLHENDKADSPLAQNLQECINSIIMDGE